MGVTGSVNSEDKNGSGDSTCTVQALEAEQVNLYKCLFDRMNDAVAYCKAVYNEKGEPTDFILIDVNTAFKRMTRVPEKMIMGKKATQFLPILSRFHMDWMEKAANVVLTRKRVTFEKYIPILNKWLLFSGFSPQRGYFAMIIKDVTWRKKVEEALRQG